MYNWYKCPIFYCLAILLFCNSITAQSYPPAAGQPGSTALGADDPLFVSWATAITLKRGFLNVADTTFALNGNNKASHGMPENALGTPNLQVVSLGDGGVATLTFENPIADGPGFDFAVFENSFNDFYLELAFVEVSSNGQDFFRFPSHSLTPSEIQIGGFGNSDPTQLNNLAGKYRGLFGTPFDLSDMPDHPNLNKLRITHVRIIDVVGSIDPQWGSYDSFGNIINDPFPTPFESGGFDLDGLGVINEAILGIAPLLQPTIKLFPNPATTHITILGTEGNVNVTIYTIEGKLISQSSHHNSPITLPTEKMATGSYLMLLVQKEKSQLFKFYIQ